MKGFTKALVATVALVLVAAACSSNSSSGGTTGSSSGTGTQGGTFSMVNCEPGTSLIPQNNYEACGSQVFQVLFSRLMTYDESGAPIGGMTGLMSQDVETWEGAAGADIFGAGSSDSSYEANTSSVDGRNGAEFAAISDAGVIAVTYTWGNFGGPPKSRGLVEWDMIFDSDSFAWSTNGAAGTMDFRNISTHELGHAMGLGHPSGSCTEETMYAYASLGETKKRDLNAGDIAGINGLY